MKLLTKDPYKTIILVILVLYILSGIKTPHDVDELVNSLLGRGVLLVLVFYVFTINPLLGGIGLIALIELFRRGTRGYLFSAPTYHHETENNENFIRSKVLRQASTSKNKRDRYLASFNQFPKTLEEEMIEKHIPFVKEKPMPPPPYKPIMTHVHSASKL